MRRIYILDTSALIFDPSVFKKFPNADVVIPIAVLNELDNLKKLPNEAGKNARVAIRLLDEISNKGDISTGILLDDDILLRIDATYIDTTLAPYLGLGDPTYGDTQILACLQLNWHEHQTNDVVLVSNDINLRVKAKARGIDSESYAGEKTALNDLYTGNQTIMHEDAGLELQQAGFIDPRNYNIQLSLHECVTFQTNEGDDIAIGRKVSHNKIKAIRKTYPWNITSRNAEQSFLIDLIMDNGIDLVTAIGQAGTGKSLLSLATALELVMNKRQFEKLIIYRPIQPVGNDIGYLPGTKEEKLAPWFQAIMDNFEFLLNNKNNNNNEWKRDLEMFQKKGKIEMEAITYIRGRSIPNAIILVDEAQNLNTNEVKTILTRAGEGTKIILTGDIEQIDSHDLDAMDNGLTYIIEKFKNSDLAGHITLTKGERSRLASEAARIL